MEFLNELLNSTNIPILSAFLLGLMTAISPCPLATNITATAFISKDLAGKNKVFISGIIYTLGRAFSYSILGLIIAFGASKFQISSVFQGYGEKVLGPLLIIIGLFMLDFIKPKYFGMSNITSKLAEKFKGHGYFSAFIIGVVFALAFCPYSGVLYFAVLIPLTIGSGAQGFLLPPIYAIGTGLPVIITAYFIAFSISRIGNLFNKIQIIERIFRKIVGAVFILTGIYYVLIFTKII